VAVVYAGRMVRLSALLAGGAALASLAAMAWNWARISSQQVMWPLPALYLIEMLVLPAAACAGLVRRLGLDAGAAWGAAGATAGFSVIGAWSVGLAYAPIALLLYGAGVVALAEARKPFLPHLLIAAVAAGLQAAAMLAAVGRT
jgi:hypothetical protein